MSTLRASTAKRPWRNLVAATVGWSALAVATASAQEPPNYFYGPHMWEGGWWMFLGPLWMIVFIAIVVGVVVLLVRGLSGSGGGAAAAASNTPLDILRERFARGEIDKDEFEDRKRVLGA